MSADEGRGREVLADTDHGTENAGQTPRRKYNPGQSLFVFHATRRMKAFYADPEIRRRYEEWMATQGGLDPEAKRALDFWGSRWQAEAERARQRAAS